jgi:hypothetical protein
VEISDDTKDFIWRCLKLEESDRIEWMEIYQHKIFVDYFADVLDLQ